MSLSIQKSQTTGVSKVTRNPLADQDVASAGRATTRNATLGDANVVGAKGKKTLNTLKDSRAAINSVTKAKSWLVKEELLVRGEVASPTALSQALMWLAARDRNTVEQLVDSIRAVALCLEDWDREAALEATNTSIKEVTASWVEEAKKELHRVAGEVSAEAKKSFETTEGRAGGRNWVDEMEEADTQPHTIQGISRAIPSPGQRVEEGCGEQGEEGTSRLHGKGGAQEEEDTHRRDRGSPERGRRAISKRASGKR